eukprot:c7912_g1_i2.p2 GENE.c7912_g1_i2~~c7912_g1_i2.p2  ORF type:complete len:127 (+),score=41.72 c7912_g1_i2:251-631(+)
MSRVGGVSSNNPYGASNNTNDNTNDNNSVAVSAAKALVKSPEVQQAAKEEARMRCAIMLFDWRFWCFVAIALLACIVIFIFFQPLVFVLVAMSLIISGYMFLRDCKEYSRRKKALAEEKERMKSHA